MDAVARLALNGRHKLQHSLAVRGALQQFIRARDLLGARFQRRALSDEHLIGDELFGVEMVPCGRLAQKIAFSDLRRRNIGARILQDHPVSFIQPAQNLKRERRQLDGLVAVAAKLAGAVQLQPLVEEQLARRVFVEIGQVGHKVAREGDGENLEREDRGSGLQG